MLEARLGIVQGGGDCGCPCFPAGRTNAQQDAAASGVTYRIVDTGQDRCCDNNREIPFPKPGEPFFGQDAQYEGNTPSYKDNHDGTITDLNTGLMWQKTPDFATRSWEDAKKYAESQGLAGHDDWRLPNVKELQSIVDYSRAPDARSPTARGPAIDPIFELTDVESWFWTSTTHLDNHFGYYVCFGQAFSARKWNGKHMNAHGAGAVRSDPKAGDPSRWPRGLGPQSDEIRICNYVRCVRGGR